MNSPVLRLVYASLLMLLFCGHKTASQIVINEISPSNISTIANYNGDFDDWIELYNAGSTAVDLAGYGLTDDISKPFLFKFPSYNLAAGSRTIIFASDHTAFAVNHYEMAVDGGASWRYKSGSAAIDTNWRNVSFDEGIWPSGNGGFGFTDGDDGTTIPICGSVMIRKTFNITDTSEIINAILMMDYDDGFVAYLNGVEIANGNMSSYEGRPLWNSLAVLAHEAHQYQGLPLDSFFLDTDLVRTIIRPGLNVLAVEVHDYVLSPTDMSAKAYLFFGKKNSTLDYPLPPSWFTTSSEVFHNAEFKLSRAGETVYLINPSGIVVDQQLYPDLESDNSFGRIPDGSSNWCYMILPTPDNTNNNSTCYTGYCDVPVLSKVAGFYDSTITVSLSSSIPGSTIRYTTNGDVPNTSSAFYGSPLTIASTQTIRARVFATGFLPSKVSTSSFIINEERHLPVFCITTDSLNLWDYNSGIYVLGPNADTVKPFFGANYWQRWSKPAGIEFYDKNQNKVADFSADIEIYGNYSRYKPQKSFEISLSDKYGEDEIHYPLISDKPFIDKFDNVILRNAGTDWNVVHFRDALMQRIMKKTHSGYVASEPAVMYLNGQFWGVYSITEKHNQNWIDANFGVDKNSVNFLEEEGDLIVTHLGKDESFTELYDYATSHSGTEPGYYDEIGKRLDLPSYTDYFIAETYYNNGDWIGEWTNNIKIWKSKSPGSRWRYILMDLDYGFGLKGSVNDNRLSMAINPIAFSHSSKMFASILGNPTYKNYFINRYADLINTIYQLSNVQNVVSGFKDSMEFDMVSHFAKWGGSIASWDSSIAVMMTFVNQRPAIMRNFINSEFHLNGEVILTLNTSPPGSGRIEISTITPSSYPWTGVYFNGNPVTITAIPNPGFTFDHWHSNSVITTDDLKKRTTYNFSSDDIITAYFTGSSKPAQLTVSEINYNSNSDYKVDDWIELYNYGTFDLDISGWKINDDEDHHEFVFPTGTVVPANGYIVVPEDSDDFKSLFPSVYNITNELGFSLGNEGDQIRISDYSDSPYLAFYYSDQAPWPLEADGEGYTCELHSASGNLGDGNNWYPGCYGGSPGKGFDNHLATLLEISGDSIICAGGIAKINTLHISDYQYQWKLDNVNISGAYLDSLMITQAGAYSVSISCKSCTASSDPVEISIADPTQPPLTFDGVRCGQGAIELKATSPYLISWYDSQGGNLIGNGKSFITPALSTTATYFARTGEICPSDYVPVVASISTDCEPTLSMYPNPSDGRNIFVRSDSFVPGSASLRISDMSGRVFAESIIGIDAIGKSNPLNFTDLPQGIYIFEVIQDEHVFYAKHSIN